MKELDQWRELNPLYRYIKSKNITHADSATVIGVSANTIKTWMRGDSCPSDLHMYVVSKFLNIGSMKLIIDWNRWMKNKPLKMKG